MIRPHGSQRTLEALATAWRALPRPVIGRITEGALQLDLRCLDEADEPAFLAQLAAVNA
jgi:L-seryl-tRNA(Ser) seleniumtransferase